MKDLKKTIVDHERMLRDLHNSLDHINFQCLSISIEFGNMFWIVFSVKYNIELII